MMEADCDEKIPCGEKPSYCKFMCIQTKGGNSNGFTVKRGEKPTNDHIH